MTSFKVLDLIPNKNIVVRYSQLGLVEGNGLH